MSLPLLVRGPLAMGILLMVILRGTQVMLGIRHSGLATMAIRLGLISGRLFSHRGSSGPLGIRLSRRLISHRGSSGQYMLVSRHLISRRGPLVLGIRLNRRLISHMLVSRRLISQVRKSNVAASNIQHQNQTGPGEAVLLVQSLHRYRRLQFSTLGAR